MNSQMVLTNFADELDNLQRNENNGRGISCVKSIISFLRLGKENIALRIRIHDGDKTNSYDKVENALIRHFGCRTHQKHNCESFICKRPH